jgi:hypothetical protein
MSNRKTATKELLKYIDKLLPGGENVKIYEEQLTKLTDPQFDAYMTKLESGEETLFLVAPNLSKNRLSVDRNLEIAKELNHNFFERLWLTDPHTGTTYLTPVPYLVVDLPLRRQAQLLNKKISIPDNNSHIDEMTGQATGPSKGSKLSFPELQTLYAQGLDRTIEELIKFRGGDTEAFRQMNAEMIDKGSVSLDALIDKGTRVKSTETLNILLKAMHFDNNL